MKDLLLLVADADIKAFLRALLTRPEALEIRGISSEIQRHQRRDSGMVADGPELVRNRKGDFGKVLLIWDHHGSGRDHRQTPHLVARDIAGRLDGVTWSGNHAVAVLDPELEQWIWHCEPALAAHLKIAATQLSEWVEAFAQRAGTTIEAAKRDTPKALFEEIVRVRLRKPISPRDFEHIGQRASIPALLACPSFAAIMLALRSWFPPAA